MIDTHILFLLEYPQRHDAAACYADGKLRALHVYTESKDGKLEFHRCWEEIEPTLAAVRAWLGY
ncbi:hypothetical protein [uncultured Desulfovibrio sp.]|uniref:hypothetical protein n=1 Tax=uncultured Desulfovibrio sp. TaxID=167968 RepID=UPI00261E9D09|nr:hypothetical protein [uncultured Desulfovibrio sp.]